jgi:hypothetical protein
MKRPISTVTECKGGANVSLFSGITLPLGMVIYAKESTMNINHYMPGNIIYFTVVPAINYAQNHDGIQEWTYISTHFLTSA